MWNVLANWEWLILTPTHLCYTFPACDIKICCNYNLFSIYDKHGPNFIANNGPKSLHISKKLHDSTLQTIQARSMLGQWIHSLCPAGTQLLTLSLTTTQGQVPDHNGRKESLRKNKINSRWVKISHWLEFTYIPFFIMSFSIILNLLFPQEKK